MVVDLVRCILRVAFISHDLGAGSDRLFLSLLRDEAVDSLSGLLEEERWHMGREARAKRARREAGLKASLAQMRPARQSADLPPYGLPGQHQRLLVRNVFRDPDDPRNHGPVGGGAGKYRVLFTLARPGVLPWPAHNFSFDVNISGDSHIAIAPPAVRPPVNNPGANKIKVRSETDDGSFVFLGHANGRGFLDRLEAEFDATSFHDAENKAYRALAPSLSNWAVHLDVPVHIWRIHLTEQSTKNQQIRGGLIIRV